MDTQLLLDNFSRYCLQVGLLTGLAAAVPALLRLKLPAARLAYWHTLLVVCVALPLVAPWQPTPIPALMGVLGPAPAAGATAVPAVPAPQPALPDFSAGGLALLALGAGALIRLIWLAVGLWKLRRYRLASQPLTPTPTWAVEADIRISEDVTSPVTFGVWRPVVLLPAGFHELSVQLQDAILAHECLHVRRRDWAITLVEEMVRAVFWFHPAIWWLLGEIQLSREQAVDRAAVEMTSAREEYVDALLAMAGASPKLDLAPAPLFLRKRHLKQRVVSLLKEASMSKARLVSALGAAFLLLGCAGWVVSGALPLMAAPQTVVDAPGVTVDVGSATLLHRTRVEYPPALQTKQIQGPVTVEVTTDANGVVTDARVLSGVAELRRQVLQSVLQWHFSHGAAGLTRQVTVNFKSFEPPASAAAGQQGGVLGSILRDAPATGQQGGVMGSIVRAAPAAAAAQSSPVPLKLEVIGFSDAAKAELLAALPARDGDMIQKDKMNAILQAARSFDEHAEIASRFGTDSALVRVSAPPALGGIMGGVLGSIVDAGKMGYSAPASGSAPAAISVGAAVQSANLIRKVPPAYPPLAKQARISGAVVLNAIIGPDGNVRNLTLASGHPLLAPAAIEAVRQWGYRPTLLNGEPVAVSTTIAVHFNLDEASGNAAQPLPAQ